MKYGDQRIIVQGVLLDNNKVLLAKRSLTKKIAPGKYHIAGGHVEYGENPEDAIAREYKEEFNIDVLPVKVLRAFSYIANNSHEVGIVYLVRMKTGSTYSDITIDKDDNEEIVWVDIKDTLNYLPKEDNDYITLTKYLEY